MDPESSEAPSSDRAKTAAEELQYEPPAIIFSKTIEAVANTCNFDPPLTKGSAGEGCTGLTFS